MSIVELDPQLVTVEVTEDTGNVTVVVVGLSGPQGPAGTLIEVEEDGVVEVTPLRNLDFRTGFDITEPTSRTAQIDLDLSEVAAGGELGGNLDAPTVDALHSGSTHQSFTDNLNAHLIDVVDSHDASAISFVPTGALVAADAQSAIIEALTDAKAYTDDGHVLLSVLRGANNGVAELDGTGKVPAVELPSLVFGHVFVDADEAAMLAESTAVPGDISVRTDTADSYILSALPASTLANWILLFSGTGAVSSVNTRTGAVTGLEEAANKGTVGGYAALDGSGYVPDAQINPAIARDTEVSDAITTHTGLSDPHPTYETAAEAQALVDTHVNDATDAHDASAVSVLDVGGLYTATDVEGALAEAAGRRGGGYVTLTDGASVSTDASAGMVFYLLGSGAHALANPSNPRVGQTVTYLIENAGTGAFATTWGNAFVLGGGWTEPAVLRARSIQFTYDGSRWFETCRAGHDLRLSSAFEPGDIAGLVAWYSATAIGQADASTVSLWRAWAGDDLTSPSGKEPIYKTAIQNGLPVVRFDGTDDYLLASNPAAGATGLSVFAVFAKASITKEQRALVDINGTGIAHAAVAFSHTDTVGSVADQSDWQFGYGAATDYNRASTVGTGWHQWSWIVVDGAQPNLYKDAGSAIGTVGGHNASVSVTQPNMYVGSHGGTIRFFYGDLAELIIYTETLNDTDRATVAAYLKTKWGTP